MSIRARIVSWVSASNKDKTTKHMSDQNNLVENRWVNAKSDDGTELKKNQIFLRKKKPATTDCILQRREGVLFSQAKAKIQNASPTRIVCGKSLRERNGLIQRTASCFICRQKVKSKMKKKKRTKEQKNKRTKEQKNKRERGTHTHLCAYELTSNPAGGKKN